MTWLAQFHMWRRAPEALRSPGSFATCLIAVGATIDAAASSVGYAGWLQSPGAAVIGAGLAILVSRLTSQAVVSEAYRKDANLRRKDELYIPIHTDVKSIRDRLKLAREGIEPFPWGIGLADASVSGIPGLPSHGIADGGTIHQWIRLRSGSRAGDFSAQARDLLDDVLQAAERYNSEVDNVIVPTRAALVRALTEKIEQTRRLRDFQLWERDHGYMQLAPNGPKEHWFKLFEGPDPPGQVADEMAGWCLSDPVNQIGVVGRLIGGRAQTAAQRLHVIRSGGLSLVPPLQWTQGVLEAALSDLEKQGSYDVARKAADELYMAANQAEAHLAMGLQTIRDRFEGGEPLV